jgi:antibiotic biosynthesis monooxygenase (ABM) superfamily enzyme
MTATAITIVHRPIRSDGRDPNPEGFDEWVLELRSVARTAPGFEESQVSVHADERLDYALAATFRTERQLNDWLDGRARAAVMAEGATLGFHRASSDLVIIEGELTPPGVAVFRHGVAAGRDADFVAAQGDLTGVSSGFPGYEGTVVFPAGVSGEWTSLIRFRTERLLGEWLKSNQRQKSLSSLRSTLVRDFSTASHTTPFGTTVRIENGKTELTPSWKSAMLVLMVLYPTVMLLTRFLAPQLDRLGGEPWLVMWLSEVASVSALQWLLMPFAAKRMRRWLDPVDGAGLAVTLRGAAVVGAVYVVTLTVFATVTWLQFWDYR